MATKKQFGSFQELVADSTKPILVDFYAPWCGPCQIMSNILDDVKSKLGQRVQIVKINTENYPDLASRYEIYALPTLMLFRGGRPVDRIEGVVSAHQLVERLQLFT
ncbi:thioredoxin [Egbenema bharatensis]|uniref:thioredoxin n=1 Tax=Egbenema bharatensis TaxID=3463334 RepID=UPI003A83EDC5